MEYWMIANCPAEECSIKMGGMYKKHGPMTITSTSMKVRDPDESLAKVEMPGGEILMPKMRVKTVGTMAIILESEKDMIAPWEPEPVQEFQVPGQAESGRPCLSMGP
jgi:predicted enzyme related to lactoylglutathione lyase